MFFWLHLKDESIVPWTLNKQNHAFVKLRVDYSKSMLANVPKMIMGYVVTDQLQQVLNAAACSMSKYKNGLSQLLHDDLHWLDVPQWVQYKLAVIVHRCLQNPSCWSLWATFSKLLRKILGRCFISAKSQENIWQLSTNHKLGNNNTVIVINNFIFVSCRMLLHDVVVKSWISN